MSKMVTRVLEQESAIRIVLGADRKQSHLVSIWQDVDVLKSIYSALSPLLSLTNFIGRTLCHRLCCSTNASAG